MNLWRNATRLNLVFEIVIVLAILTVLFLFSSKTQAAAAEAPAAAGVTYWYVCNGAPNNHIAVFTNRIHVFCSSTTPVAGAPALDANILWFSVPTAPDSAGSSRFLSLLQTAVLSAKPIWLMVDPTDTSGSSFGCGTANCRPIYAVEMR